MNTNPAPCISCGGPYWISDDLLCDTILADHPRLRKKAICQGCLVKAEAVGHFAAEAIATGTTVPQILEGILENYSN